MPRVLDAFAALAPDLHRTICWADEAELAAILDRRLARYFRAQGAGAGGSRAGPRPPRAERDLDYLSGSWTLEQPLSDRRSPPELRRDPRGSAPAASRQGGPAGVTARS